MKVIFTYFIKLLLIIPVGSIFPQNYSVDETCPKGMISYWKLDEFGDVSIYTDSYGGHDATVQNSNHPTEDSGIVNSSRFFYNSSAVNVPNNDVFNWKLNTSFSIELWIKTNESGTGNKVFIGRYSSNSQLAWWIGFGNNNKAIFSVRDSSGNESVLEGKKIINDKKWHHIVGIKNDTLKALQLFVDGAEENKISTFFSSDFSGNSPIYFGYYNGSFHYSGWIDEIAIYKVALTNTQIMNHYKNGLLGKSYCDQFISGINNENNISLNYILNQNYPNPFNPTTFIIFSISHSSIVKLEVYNILGEHIRTLIDRYLAAGNYKTLFDAYDLPSGIYVYELKTDKSLEVKKMILQK